MIQTTCIWLRLWFSATLNIAPKIHVCERVAPGGANISRINVDTMYNIIYQAHIYPSKIANKKKKIKITGPISGSPDNHDNPSCNSVHIWVHINEMKTWNVDTAMPYFLLYFRFAKRLWLHLVAILDSCKIERQVQFDGVFVLISIANFNPHSIALITYASSMTSDLGACDWLLENHIWS